LAAAAKRWHRRLEPRPGALALPDAAESPREAITTSRNAMARDDDEEPVVRRDGEVTVSTRWYCDTGRSHVVEHDVVVIGGAPEAKVHR
jgi:hypothetical protein